MFIFAALLLGNAPSPINIVITFQDGSVVKMALLEKALAIQTKYGTLQIPREEIRRVEFGAPDTIQTVDGPLIGKILGETIRGSSPYFGELALKRADLRSIQVRYNSQVEVEKVVAPDETVDTGLQVQAGDSFTITAIGQVDLWPQGPGQYIVTARGYLQQNGKNSPYPAGALLGKVGEQVFVIGERWEGVIKSSGQLQLSIVPGPWESIPQGNYRVTIKGRP